MMNLQEVGANHWCKISWLIGSHAETLRKMFRLREESALRVIANSGNAVIVDYAGKKIAMSGDVADNLKVVCLD